MCLILMVFTKIMWNKMMDNYKVLHDLYWIIRWRKVHRFVWSEFFFHNLYGTCMSHAWKWRCWNYTLVGRVQKPVFLTLKPADIHNFEKHVKRTLIFEVNYACGIHITDFRLIVYHRILAVFIHEMKAYKISFHLI